MSSKLSGCMSRSRAHAAAVELEDPEGVAAPQQLVGRRVGHVLGQGVEVDVLAAVGLRMLASASSRIVRLRRPRKSILTRPRDSQLG
jgi:hypothetical protein